MSSPTCVSYVITLMPAEKDGRFWVYETHTLSDGSTLTFPYLAAAVTVPTTVATTRAAEINANVAAGATI